LKLTNSIVKLSGVQTRAEFAAGLENAAIDLVLADYNFRPLTEFRH
jgi:hypothetical protein